MTSRTAKAATITAGVAVVLLALLAYSAIIAPAAAQTATSTTATSTGTKSQSVSTNCTNMTWQGGPPQGGFTFGNQHGIPGQGFGRGQSRVNVTVGTTIVLASTQGEYYVVGSPTKNGTASGTLTFTVTGSLSEGYTLTLTSGSIVVGGTTYTISSGTAQMSPAANSISGQGATTPSGEFILQASAHGSFVGSSGTVSLDLSAGTTEYLINLTTSVQG